MVSRKKELKRGAWSKGEVKLLRKNFGSHSTKDVAKALCRPLDAVKKKASRLGLRKTKRYLKSLGRA